MMKPAKLLGRAKVVHIPPQRPELEQHADLARGAGECIFCGRPHRHGDLVVRVRRDEWQASCVQCAGHEPGDYCRACLVVIADARDPFGPVDPLAATLQGDQVEGDGERRHVRNFLDLVREALERRDDWLAAGILDGLVARFRRRPGAVL